MTGLAQAVVDLGGLAMAFGRIDRTAVFHPGSDQPESDSDHTVMLGWVAPALAARCFPTLDVGLVAQFALVHDAPEVYAGDTPTLRIDAAGLAAKALRERAAARRLVDEFGRRLPWFAEMIALYERQELPEARFVRAVDKLLPKVVSLLNGCAGLREHQMHRPELEQIYTREAETIARYAGEFSALMALRAELTTQVLDHPMLAPAEGVV
jgi:putative hydrolase of HD superfamily